MSVFVDTSAILAILNSAEEAHERAGRTYRRLLETEEHLVSTNYVVLETVALLQRRIGIAAVRKFQDDILPTLDVVWLTSEDHETAMELLLKIAQRRLSLVDCSSFVVMRRRGIRGAFGFDGHFSEHGFQEIPG